MPRQRVRVRVVCADNAGALQLALDQALDEEQVDRSWHVSDVTLASVACEAVLAGAVVREPCVALISLQKQEWFFTDLLKGLVDFVRGKLSPRGDPAGS